MSQRDCNGITQQDNTSPVAVASGRERPCKGLLLPIRTDAENTVKEIASGYTGRQALEAAAAEPRYIVFVEAAGQITTRVTCWRDSEHDTREQAYTRLQAMLPSHPGRLVWIETAHSLPFALDQRRYWEVPKP